MWQEYWVKWALGILGAAATGLITYLWSRIKKDAKYVKAGREQEVFKNVYEEIDELRETTLGEYTVLNNKIEILLSSLDILREGILSAHYNALKDKCIMYINAGHISIYELENIEEEFTLYKKLGGNGHMDALIEKVRKLKTTQE